MALGRLSQSEADQEVKFKRTHYLTEAEPDRVLKSHFGMSPDPREIPFRAKFASLIKFGLSPLGPLSSISAVLRAK